MDYMDESRREVAPAVGGTIKEIELNYSVVTITLEDGRELQFDTCSCCGLDGSLLEGSD